MNVAMNTIVMIVLLEYGGTLVAENLVSLSFSEMTCEKIHCLVTSWRVIGRKENDRSVSLRETRYRSTIQLTISLVRHPASKAKAVIYAIGQ